ncbi:hypothetical protein [uncultured Oceanisphaera sp.]|uniref:hypothetical protein n=1 Tax=uncultured Oceanisphaera sp. TaxID=353858 RepID=UPI002624FD95|nr:hypothetical protein [uncultured Oceanisphaera sp.]
MAPEVGAVFGTRRQAVNGKSAYLPPFVIQSHLAAKNYRKRLALAAAFQYFYQGMYQRRESPCLFPCFSFASFSHPACLHRKRGGIWSGKK